ncbi:MAG: hypothetical protein JW755_13215 [Candidatus Aminicenantes bacterium]|nr:hypothetical protein [Candidatus Aminicenantes bacterium]
MRNITIFTVILWLCLPGICQDIQEKSLVINVEVPVRIFKDGNFIDTLSIKDFELYENGALQKVEALYLIKKRTIERSDEVKRFFPKTNRNFYLLFEVTDYNEQLRQAIDYFVQYTMAPGDNLTIVTPMKTYKLRGDAIRYKPREDIADQFVGLLRKDTLQGNSTYRNVIDEMKALASALSRSFQENSQVSQDQLETDYSDQLITTGEFRNRSIDEQLMMYETLLNKLENLRSIDQKKLLDFADHLKGTEGQKYVYVFYQNEFIPQIQTRILNQYLSRFQDRPNIQQTISNLFEFYRRDINIDVSHVKQAYADASISIHFLFLTAVPLPVPGVQMFEQSEDIFSAFREMALATGGYIESSANPEALFQNAVEATDNYYLLYYTPSKYMSDGTFKQIEVKVKGNSYQVFHRAGYFAN